MTLQAGFGSLGEDGYSVVFSLDAQWRDKLQQDQVGWMAAGNTTPRSATPAAS